MHATAETAAKAFAKKLPEDLPLRICDVGSYNVNGCLRPHFNKPPWTYVGMDMAAGPNVDIVIPAQGKWDAIQDDSYDVVLSVSTLEHAKYPWLMMQELARITKPGGILWVNCPYAWPYHTFPIDCWRIYPDGLRAIMELAGLEVDDVCMKEVGKNPDCGDTFGIARKPFKPGNAGGVVLAPLLREWRDIEGICKGFNGRYGLNDNDLRVIYDVVSPFLAKDSVIVEIGVGHGRTGAMLAYLARRTKSEYHGIDHFGFDGSSKAAIKDAFTKLGLPATFHEGDSNGNTGRPLACQKWTKKVNVLYIDGGHDEGNVRGDCETWIPHVAPGGIVIFNDWNDGLPHSNPHWAIKHYSELHCVGWAILRTNQKLHIRRKP